MLIGLNGRLRSGKDTAYKILASNPNYKATFQRVGFADKLKLSFVRALGFDISDPNEAVALANHIKESGELILNWHEGREGTFKYHTFTGREAQQWWGTEGHRDVFGEDFWIDALLPRVIAELPARLGVSDVTFVTDTRFPNEAKRILDLGGSVWRIDADERLGPLHPEAHSSEAGLPDELVTHVIDNNADEHAFKINVNQAYMESVEFGYA